MTISKNKLFCGLFLAVAVFVANYTAAQTSPQETFPTAEDAVVAMVDALKANNVEKLVAIFGPEARDVMSSGDAVADQRGRDLFVAAYFERSSLSDGATSKTLYIGSEEWPFPIPLVKGAGGWRFDTAAGIEEIRYRRIGRNELATIRACEAYVAAQKEYAQKGHDSKAAGAYARKLASEPGKQDGLFWKVNPGEDPSPLGELAAEAASEGYTRATGKPTPFRGYFFRILTAQGAGAKGGAKSYLVNGEMRNGFAMVAFPAEYGNSGVMTFIVNQDGVVFEKDLGEETAKLAGEMKEYNADNTWRRAKSPGQ
jgi:hypothetical protein